MVYALNSNGEITICKASEENIGKGRCNHLLHQKAGESNVDFMTRAQEYIEDHNLIKDIELINTGDDLDLYDMSEITNNLCEEYSPSFCKNVDYAAKIKEMWNDGRLINWFDIGVPGTEDYKKAELIDSYEIDKFNDRGDHVKEIHLVMEFEGQQYDVDFGQVPFIEPDGTIQINGAKFRFLPTLERMPAGLYYNRKTGCINLRKAGDPVVEYCDRNNYYSNINYDALSLSVRDKCAILKSKRIPLEDIQAYFDGKPTSSKLEEMDKRILDMIDPIVYERFPELRKDVRSFVENYQDCDSNDITWRRVLTMEDFIMKKYKQQFYRMGQTFRTNYAKKVKANEEGATENEKIRADNLPLFYQGTNTTNIINFVEFDNMQYADNLNPLASLSQASKISLTGREGGASKEHGGDAIRRVHPSYKGLVDPLDVSSGKNIGYTFVLSGDSDIDKNGLIRKAPSRRLSVSDFIPYKYNNDGNRAGYAVSHMKQACTLVDGEDPRPLGDPSDKAWSKISGSKLGVNCTVAYIPGDFDHEDSVAMSESMAKRFATIKANRYIADEPIRGVKVGDRVRAGDIIGGQTIKFNGKIASIDKNNKSFSVNTRFQMDTGDKVAGRHGNKGTISRVIPDKDMPIVKQPDGTWKRADVLMSPKGVAGRMNIGQIYETNNTNGDGSKNLEDKKIVKLSDGSIIQATAGTQFVMRLNHIAEEKLQAYSEQEGMKMGYMERLLLTSNEKKLELLRFMSNQNSKSASDNLDVCLKAIGVNMRRRDTING